MQYIHPSMLHRPLQRDRSVTPFLLPYVNTNGVPTPNNDYKSPRTAHHVLTKRGQIILMHRPPPQLECRGIEGPREARYFYNGHDVTEYFTGAFNRKFIWNPETRLWEFPPHVYDTVGHADLKAMGPLNLERIEPPKGEQAVVAMQVLDNEGQLESLRNLEGASASAGAVVRDEVSKSQLEARTPMTVGCAPGEGDREGADEVPVRSLRRSPRTSQPVQKLIPSIWKANTTSTQFVLREAESQARQDVKIFFNEECPITLAVAPRRKPASSASLSSKPRSRR